MDEVSKPKQLVKPRDAKPCGHCILNWLSLTKYAVWEPFWRKNHLKLHREISFFAVKFSRFLTNFRVVTKYEWFPLHQ